jgi:hypothetical protein
MSTFLKAKDKIMSYFSVGICPSSKQKRTLNHMLKGRNYAYKWCNYLVKEKHLKPKHFYLPAYMTEILLEKRRKMKQTNKQTNKHFLLAKGCR